MFGLWDESEKIHLRRHRLFESPLLVIGPGGCHCSQVDTAHVTGNMGNLNRHRTHGVHAGFSNAKIMMGIDWMNRDELAQAIPPAYTEWIGQRLMESLP